MDRKEDEGGRREKGRVKGERGSRKDREGAQTE